MADPTQLDTHIEFVSEQEQQFFAEAMLGDEVRDFLNSTTGRFLHGRAKIVRDKCVSELFELDPYTPEGKREFEKLKREASIAEYFMQWCAEAIINGNNAESQLSEYRREGN